MFSMRSVLNIFFLVVVFLAAQRVYSQERIKDFYLSNYKEDGSQDWEMQGVEATVHNENVDIDKMKAKYYTEGDTITVQSEKAKLNKKNLDVFLKDNVHIENSQGAKLLTDSLNWKKEANSVKTDDWVEVTNESMQIKAKGLAADTQLKKVDFQKDVEAKLSQEGRESIIITCTGPLEIEGNEGKAVFNDNVVVEHTQGKMFSDKATVFFDNKEKKILKIVSSGHVKIVKDDNVTFAQKATYLGNEQRIVLEGSPRLIYFPKEGEKVPKF